MKPKMLVGKDPRLIGQNLVEGPREHDRPGVLRETQRAAVADRMEDVITPIPRCCPTSPGLVRYLEGPPIQGAVQLEQARVSIFPLVRPEPNVTFATFKTVGVADTTTF